MKACLEYGEPFLYNNGLFYLFMKSNEYCFSYNELFAAYEDCIENKKNTSNAMAFSANYIENVIALCDDINNGTYKIGKSIAFVVRFPVYREVFAADFRDRVVHHLIINELMPYFEKEFIDESFSCMDGKGVFYGVDTIYRYIKECTNGYTEDAWILKMDIKSFFMSIVKEKLANMVDDFIARVYPDDNIKKKNKLRELFRMVIMHHPELNCERRGDLTLWDKLEYSKSLFNVGSEKGLPIGNLTSQILANFYLSKLDKFIKYELGFQYYGRYVDDFVIICKDKQRLLDAVPLIVDFAKRELSLTIHPNKRYVQHYKNGVRFIGGILKENRFYILNRTKGSLYYKLSTKFAKPSERKLDKLIMTVNSYLGFMRHYNSYNLRKKILTKQGLLDNWSDLIVIDKRYRKITRKNKNKQKIGNIAEEFIVD